MGLKPYFKNIITKSLWYGDGVWDLDKRIFDGDKYLLNSISDRILYGLGTLKIISPL